MEAAMQFAERWQSWIYPALALYAAVKSGLLPVFAAALASVGALDAAAVAGALLTGTVLGEEAKFHAGRWFGPRMMTGRPRLAAVMARTEALLARWGVAWVLLYRWPKGGRTLGALPLGLAGWSWPRFAPLNLCGAVLWTGGVMALGLTGGPALIALLERWGGAVTFAMLCLMALAIAAAFRRTTATSVGT